MNEALDTNEQTTTSVAPQEHAAELATRASVEVADNPERPVEPVTSQPRYGYYDGNLHGNDDWANLA